MTLSGSGTSNSFGTISGTTNANGVFTTTLASTLAQTETITATEGSVHEVDFGDVQSGHAVGDDFDVGSEPGIGDRGRRIHHHADRDGGGCPGQSRSERGGNAVGQRHREQLRHHLRHYQRERRFHNHAGLDAGPDRDHHRDRRQCARVDFGDVQSGHAVGDDLDVGSEPGIGDADGIHHHADVTVEDAQGNFPTRP